MLRIFPISRAAQLPSEKLNVKSIETSTSSNFRTINIKKKYPDHRNSTQSVQFEIRRGTDSKAIDGFVISVAKSEPQIQWKLPSPPLADTKTAHFQ